MKKICWFLLLFLFLFCCTFIVSGSESTLRPNGAGALSECTAVGDSPNYACVDEITKDDGSTYVKVLNNNQYHDVYALTDNTSTMTGVINSVTVYAWCREAFGAATSRVLLYVDGTKYESGLTALGAAWQLTSHTWTTNPSTGSAWTVSNITNLQAGVELRGYSTNDDGRCTQVYVVVNHTIPDPPYNGDSSYNSTSNIINLTWTKGNDSDYDVVVSSSTGFPDSVTDGTIVQNDSSLTFYTFTPSTTAYYSVFTFNSTESTFSVPLDIPWGVVGMNCYNESNPAESIGFDIEVSNQDGTDVYQNSSLTNTFYIFYEDIPFGTNTIITVNNSSYEPRQYYYDFVQNTFYNLSFYLPPIIQDSVDTELYTIRVIDSYTFPVANADVTIKRYNNQTEVYETVTSKITNGYGECDAYLMPGTNYKFFVEADGFDDFINDSFTDPDFYGKNYPIILQLDYSDPDYDDYDFWDVCTFNATMHSNNTIEVNYVDSLSETTSATFETYELYNDTESLASTNITTSNSFTFWITNINTSRSHRIELELSHTSLGTANVSIMVLPIYTNIRSITAVNTIFSNILGDWDLYDGGLGYVEFFLIFIPFIVIVGIASKKQHAGGGIIIASLYGAFMTTIVFSHDIQDIWPFIAAVGAVLATVKGGMIDL